MLRLYGGDVFRVTIPNRIGIPCELFSYFKINIYKVSGEWLTIF